MNVSATLPLAAVSAGSAGSSDALPAGFTDVLAAQLVAGGETDAETGHGGDGTEDGRVGDLLALAALASRSAHASLPHLPVVGSPDAATAAATTALDALGVEAAAPVGALTPDELTATVASEQPFADTAQVVGATADGAADLAPEEAPPVPVVVDAPAGGEVPVAADTERGAAASQPRPADEATEVSGPDPVGSPTSDAPDTAPTAGDEPLAPKLDAPGGAGDDVVRSTDPQVAPVTTDSPDAVPGRERQAPVGTVASERGRERPDATAGLRAAGDAATRTESVDAGGQPVPAQPVTTGRPDPLAPSAAAQRVLDIVSQLEDAPPPRVVVIETGEMRLRVGLDAGVVRLTVLGTLGEVGEEVLREAADALEAGGFGTQLDRGHDGGDQPEHRDPRDRSPRFDVSGPARPSSRSRAGLQL